MLCADVSSFQQRPDLVLTQVPFLHSMYLSWDRGRSYISLSEDMVLLTHKSPVKGEQYE